MKLGPNFRFRQSWTGKMILQKKETRTGSYSFPDMDIYTYDVWVDATWEDLLEIKEILKCLSVNEQ